MVIAMMLLAGAAFATTYYVATDGDNANDGLTAQTAWLDINYGDRAQILQPGDVVLVQPGTYEGSTISGDDPAFGYEFSKCSGTEGNPITYKANGEVIIDNATTTTDSVHTKDLTIHADYVVVEGFKLTGAGMGVNGNGTGSWVRNCEMYDLETINSIWPNSAGVYIEGEKSLNVEGCYIHDIPVSTNESFGIYTMASFWSSTPGPSAIFRNNLFYNIKGGGICVRGGRTDDQIYNNTIVNCVNAAIGVVGGNVIPGSAIAKNNVFFSCGKGLLTDGGTFAANDHNVFFNCTTNYQNAAAGHWEFNADPLFVDEWGMDYTPADGSPAINVGVDMGLPYNGSAPDLGAFESNADSYCGFISGTVADLSGNPIAMAYVTTTENPDVYAYTASDGTYTLPLDSGSYTVTGAAAGYDCVSGNVSVSVTTGNTATADFDMTRGLHTYYASPDGDDSNDGLSPESPWFSIDNGCKKAIVAPGDTIIVLEGTYELTEVNQFNINSGGSADYPVTYKAQGNVVLNGEYVAGALLASGFRVTAPNLVFDGFEITDTIAGFWIQSGSYNVEIKNCDIHNLSHTTEIFPNCAGVYVEGGPAVIVDVHDNYIHDLTNVASWTTGVYDMSCFNNDASGQPGSSYYRNIFKNIEGQAFHFRGTTNNAKVFNNTIDNCWYGVLAWAGYGSVAANIGTVCNNIFANGAYAFWVMDGGSITSSYNLFYNLANGVYNGTEVAIGTGSITANPMLNADYTLQDESPAINAGIDMGIDYIGSAPDMGAKESEVVQVSAGVITGTVTRNDTGGPMKGVPVSLDGTDFATTTDVNGEFAFNVRPGSYTVVASDTDKFTVDAPTSQSVTVAADETVTVNFTGDFAGNVYYVDAANGDDGNDGSAEFPFATITAADNARLLEPGDTVIVRAGTYNVPATGYDASWGVTNCSGEVGLPIVYKAEEGVYVVNTSDPGDRTRAEAFAMLVRYVSNVTFEGFDFSGGTVCFRIESANNILVKDCVMHDTDYTTAIWPQSAGIYIGSGTFEADNCKFYDIGLTAPGESFGVYTMVGWGVNGYTPSYVHNCVFDNIHGSAFIARGGKGNDKFYNNTVNNCWGGVAVVAGSVVPGTATAYNNIITNCDRGLINEGAGITASHNLIYGCRLAYVSTDPGEGALAVDPQFTDAAGRDFTLSDTSPAVNTGMDVGIAYKGVAPDMGAYETDVQDVPTGNVVGTVSDNGRPVAGITVSLDGTGISTVTGTDGKYILTATGGNYTVVAEGTSRVTIADNSKAATITGGQDTEVNFEAVVNTTTYYVSTNGSDSNDGLTPETAWANMDNGCVTGVVQPGDTVIVLEGTYAFTEQNQWEITTGGAQGFPVTYKAQGNVLLDGNAVGGVAVSSAIRTRTVSHVVIDGFEIVGSMSGLWLQGGTDIEVKNCDIHNLSYTSEIFPNCAAIYTDSGITQVVDVHDNYIHDQVNVYGWTTGIYDMSCFNADGRGLPGSKYYRNVFENIEGCAMHFRGTNNDVQVYNNTFINCWYGVLSWAGYGTYPAKVTAKNNIFHNSAYAFRVMDGATIISDYNLFGTLNNGTTDGIAVTVGEHSITADPLLDANFVPTAGSPAIDAGCDMGLDFLGSALDMGAKEFDPSAVEYTEVDSVAALDELADGTFVETDFDLIAVTATGTFDDGSVYGETADRLAGVKFDLSGINQAVAVGDTLRVKGVVASDADGKYIVVSAVTSQTSGDALGALGLTNVTLNNDVLVRVWGKIVSEADGTFVINNGMGDVTVKGATTAAVGDFVTVTGVATDTGVRAIEVL